MEMYTTTNHEESAICWGCALCVACAACVSCLACVIPIVGQSVTATAALKIITAASVLASGVGRA